MLHILSKENEYYDYTFNINSNTTSRTHGSGQLNTLLASDVRGGLSGRVRIYALLE
jgi:hypothetical protein